MREKFQGKTCVVTGAGGGIGRELAISLAEHGARLAISDIDEKGLAETRAAVSKLGNDVRAQRLDVADKQSVFQYRAIVNEQFGVVHQVYNNAGISGGGRSIAETPDDLIDRVININLMGVLNGSRAFLPDLIASGSGVLVNVSSLNGLMAQPNVAIYCLTKYAVRGLTEAIRADALFYEENLQVVTVHPGGVKTNIAKARQEDLEHLNDAEQEAANRIINAYQTKFLTYPATDAAKDILKGVAKGKSRIVVTPQAKRLDRLVRLFPSRYVKIVANASKKIRKSIEENA